MVGTPKGSVAASHGVSRAMAGLVWVEGPLGHAWPANLGGSISCHSPVFLIFCTKNGMFGVETSIILGFFTFLDVSRFYVLFFEFDTSLT